MKLNGTLFIQMLNFGIAYCMIRYFLLRPIVPLIMQERKKIVELHYRIVNNQESLATLAEQQEAAWQKLNEYTKNKQIPSFFDKKHQDIIHFDLPSAPVEIPDDTELKKVSKEIIDSIMHQKIGEDS